MRRSVCKVLAMIAAVFVILTAHASPATARHHSANAAEKFRVSHQEQDSLFQYGRYGEAKFLLTSDYYRRYRLVRANAFESVVPPGLKITTSRADRRRGRTNIVHISGRALFVGKWCFNLALHIRVMLRDGRSKHPTVIKQVCLFGQDNADYNYHKVNATLPIAVKGSNYRASINLSRSGRGRGVSSHVLWHDVPVSMRVRSGHRMITLSGTPTDRYGYRLPKGYQPYAQPIELGEFTTHDDLLTSKFTNHHPIQYGYRITAMYPDGETRSNFVRLVKVSKGKIVMGILHYQSINGNEPLYLNVFRSAKGEGEPHYQLVAQIPPSGSGSQHVIDTNLPSVHSLTAVGTYYINLKHQPYTRNAGVSYQQFELQIVD